MAALDPTGKALIELACELVHLEERNEKLEKVVKASRCPLFDYYSPPDKNSETPCGQCPYCLALADLEQP